MASQTKNMTTGKPGKLILSFALPLMLGNVFQQLYTVVDTMVVGKYLGVNALAALGAADWMNWMMLGIVQGFTQGFGILMAQKFGAGKEDQLKKVIGNSVFLSAVFAIFLVLLGQTPDTILGDTLLYLRIMFAGIPIVMAYNLLACILRSLGDGKTPLHAMIVASFTNIALDLLFVMVFHWGIAGAAIATLLAQLVSAFYCFFYIRKLEILKLHPADFALEKALCGKLLKLGSPIAFQSCIISIGGMIVQSVVNGFGVIFIAGFTATNKLYGILEIAATSYGYAMITYIGQNMGAGKTDRIHKGMRSALTIALITSMLIGAFMLLFGKWILGWFISGTPEEVTLTLQIAYLYLAIMSVCLPILYILYVIRSAIQGMGYTLLPMCSGIAEFIMRTVTALLLPHFVGEIGIFFAEIAAWTGADIVLVISWFVTVKRLPKTQDETDRLVP